MSFSLDELPDALPELPYNVKLMREALDIIAKFLPDGLAVTGTGTDTGITNKPLILT